MKKAKKSVVFLSFKLNDAWQKNNQIILDRASKFDGDCIESGAGFGERDMEFIFPDKNRAEEFGKTLKKEVKLINLYIE